MSVLGDYKRWQEDQRQARTAVLPPVRSEPLLAAYERFKHLDSLFEKIRDDDGTEDSDPFHASTRDLWRAIKESLGHTANARVSGAKRTENAHVGTEMEER